MKKVYKYACLSLLGLFLSLGVFSQCANDNTLWIDLTPASCPGSASTSCIFGGEYCTVTVVSGNTYVFQSCGDTDFDTEITLYNQSAGTVISYNDDGCGDQSTITWVATFSGVVRVLVDKYPCADESTCMTLAVSCSPPGGNVYTQPISGLDGTYLGACMVNTCNATFYDNGGSGSNYSNSINSIYRTFCPSQPNTCVTATISAMSIEDASSSSCYDYIRVLNGPTQNSTDLWAGCGDLGAPVTLAGTWSTTYTSTDASGCLGFRFRSDGTVNESGWAINLSCSPCAGGPSATGTYDCSQATSICGTANLVGTSNGPGLSSECNGCAISENFTSWYKITIASNGTLAFTLNPNNNAEDYDFALFGPSVNCGALGSPIRCSYAAITANGNTGMGNGAVDNSETVSGDGWVSSLAVTAGQTYILMINGWSAVSSGFNINWSTGTTTFGVPAGSVTVQTNSTCSGQNQGEACAVVNSGVPPYVYTWSSGPATSCIYNQPSGNYTVTVTDASLCTSIATGNIASIPTPASPTASGTSICYGNTATVSATAPGGTYEWYTASSGGTLLQTGASYTTPALTATTTYYVQTTSGGCTSTRTAVVVTVNPLPTVFSVGGGGSFCSGGSGVNVTLSGSQVGVNYQLFINGSPSSTIAGTGALLTWANQLTAGTYTVVATNASTGCYVNMSGSATVVVNSLPSAPGSVSASPASICTGGSSTISATIGSGGTAVYWYTGGCGTTYLNSGTSLSVSPASTTTYYALTYNSTTGCYSSTCGSTTVTVNSPPTASASNTGPYCAGQTIQLNSLPNSMTSYSWSGPSSFSSSVQNPARAGATTAMAGTYTVTVINASGCSSTATTNVTVNSLPTATASNTGPYCEGATIQLNLATTGTSYSWTGPGSFSSALQNPTRPSATTAMSGTYNVTVTGTGGCTNTSSTSVTVNATPTATASNTGPYCEGATIQLNLTTTGTSYSWTGPGSFTSALQNPTRPSATTAMSGTYNVTVTGTGGCTNTSSTSVTVNATPTASASNTGPYCAGATIQLNLTTTGTSYSWSGPGSWSSALQNPTRPSSTTAMSGTYSVTVTGTGGCTNTSSTSVTVNAAITATASNTGPYCEGSTISLSSSGGTSYSWSGPGSWSSAVQNPTRPSATTAMAGTYTVTVTGTGGCTGTANTTVTVNTNPVASASNTGPYCEGATISLSSLPAAMSSYSWSGPGSYSASGQNVTRPSSTVAMAGTYTVTVTNSNNCTGTATTTVVVNTNPTASASNTGPYCEGSTIQLNSLPNAMTTYAWSGPGSFSASTQNTTRPAATVAMGGTYTVTVTNSNNCTSVANTTVTVNTNPTAAASNTGPYCEGSTISLSSSGGTTYSWTGPSSFSSTNQNPTRPSSTLAMAGTYTVTVTNANSCTSTATTTVTVNANPTATASNTGPYCEGATISLSSSGGTSYTWSGPSSFSSTAQNPTRPSATVAMAGVYTVTVTNASSCTATATTTVVVNTNPVITASNTGPYCVGQTIQLNTTAGTSYSWTGPSSFSSTNQNPTRPGATVAMAGVYNVTVTNASGCTATTTTTVVVNTNPSPTATNTGPYCVGQTIQLNSSGGTFYNWSGPLAYSSTAQNPTIASATTGMAGTYTVTVTNASSCTATATTTVVVNANPVANAGSDVSIPFGTNTTLAGSASGGSGSYSYLWSPAGSLVAANVQNPQTTNLTTTTVYTVTVTDLVTGCTSTDQVTVTVTGGALAVTVSATPNVICAGQSTTINAVATGGSGTYTYTWSSAPAGFNPGNNPSGSSTPGATTTYNVTVNDGFNTVTGNVTVTVNSNPVASASNTGPYCEGATISLSSLPNGMSTYSWSGPASFSSALQNPTRGSATVAMAGVYTVTVTNASNCISTATTTVVVNTNPTPSASNTGPYCEGSTISLSSLPAAMTSYSWSGPGAFTASTQNTTRPSATVAMAGVYTVTITNASSCTATATTTVVVNTNPTPSASNTGPYCEGATIQLNSLPNGLSYSWAGPSSFTSTSQNPTRGSATVAMAGIYTVTVTNASSCTATATTTVTVNTNPTPTASNTGPYCAGATIALSSSGGTSYNWSGPSSFSSSVQNPTIAGATTAMAGTYYVTVTNASSCTATSNTTVTVNTNPVSSASNTGPYCEGATIQLNSSGGTSYSWSGPSSFSSTNQNPTRPSATLAMSGTYTVTVTNASSCTSTATTNVTVNANPVPSASNTGPYCEGATISLSSLPAAMSTYSWSGPGSFTASTQSTTRPSATTVMAGIYSVTVTNASSCTATASTTVVVNTNPTPTASNTGPYCEGSTIQLNSLPAGMSYSWDGPLSFTSSSQNPTIASSTVAMAGLYTVTVTNASSCTATVTTTVVVNTNPVPSASNTGPYCEGSTISLSSLPSGMSTYLWSGPGSYSASTQNPTRPSASVSMSGTYNVTVTNSNNCTATASTNVTVNPLPVAYNVTGGGHYCSGGTGQPVGLSNSQPNTTYELYLNGVTTGLTINGTGGPVSFGMQTAAGTYTVVAISNTSSCTNNMTGSVTVTIDALPVVNAGTDQTIPFGTFTSLNASVTGGSGSFTYSWSPSGSLVTSNIEDPVTTNLTVTTTYTLIATDVSTGCQGSDQVIVNITGSALNAAANATPNPICNGQNTQLNANATGGAGSSSYVYSWSSLPAGFTSTLANPTVSPTVTTTYYVTVNDGFNSATSSVQVIVLPLPSQFEVSGSGSYCSGGTGLTIILNGSQIGVTYQLYLNGTPTGLSQPGTTAGLAWANQTTGGVYTVVATNNATGCSNVMAGSATVTVNNLPSAFNVTGGGNYCSGGAGVDVALSGSEIGINYQLLLNGTNIGAPVSGNGSSIDFGYQTSSGIYTVVATNVSTTCVNNMTGNASVIIDPLPNVFNLTGGGNYCSGGAGLPVGLSGSETGIDYQLLFDGVNEGSPVAGDGNPLNFGTFTNAGTYTVIATNTTTSCVNNMGSMVNIVIDPLPSIYNVTGGGTYCSNTNGVDVILNGSDMDVTYTLFIDGIATTNTIVGNGNILTFSNQTTVGNYTIQGINNTTSCISDMSGSVNVSVNPTPVMDSLYIVPLTSCVSDNGEFTVYASNGTDPLSFSIDGINYSADSVFTSLPSGTTTCYITDVNNCGISINVDIPDSTGFAIDSVLVSDVLCNGASTGQISVFALNATQYSIDNGSTYQPSNVFTGLTAGSYTVVAMDNGGCNQSSNVTVQQPQAMTSIMYPVNVTCFGYNNGSAEIRPSGGIQPYTYLWDDSEATDSSIVDSLIADIYYHVTVTDDNGCIMIDSVMLMQPPQLSIIMNSTNVLCFAENNGTATVSVNGGTPTYTYQWDNPGLSNTANVNDLFADSLYFVTVTDNNGCFAIDSVIVTQPVALTVEDSVTQATCGGSDGSIELTVSGGTTPYTYNWSNTQTTPVITGLPSGNYLVTVSDANGCSYTNSFTIVNLSAGNIQVTGVTNVLCYGDTTGTITVSLTGGTPDFTFEWSTGDSIVSSVSSNTLTGLSVGSYFVTVTDANGCISDTVATVIGPTAGIVPSVSIQDVSCAGMNDGVLIGSATGGTPPYAYNWSNSQAGAVITNLPGGTYSVTVTDNSGCSVIDSGLVVIEPLILRVSNSTVSPACGGDSTGSVITNVIGGTPPYSYAWSTQDTTSSITNIPAGQYIVTVTDDHGCPVISVITVTEPSLINVTYETGTDPANNAGFIDLTVVGGGLPYTFLWSNNEVTEDIYNLTGGWYTYYITDANTCLISDSVFVELELGIPNTITPNGDGYNDDFFIINIEAYEKVNIQIWSQWDELLYEFSGTGVEYNQTGTRFDGLFNGAKLPMGAYLYIISIDVEKVFTGALLIKY